MKFYSLTNILKEKAQYNMIFGERSNGKSYAVLEYILKEYQRTGKQGAIIRRMATDFDGRLGKTVFEPLEQSGLVTKYTDGEWTGITYKAEAWYFYKPDAEDPKGKKLIISGKPFCYGFALSKMEHYKSTSYPDITTVLFDEFLTRTGYLNDEFVIFMNMLSTIIRYRSDVTIFMLGNTVNKDCPYFHEMGLSHVDEMKAGEIAVYKYGKSKLRVAVEYAGAGQGKKRIKKPSDFYFAFNNPSLRMITGGAWEIGIYGHKPCKFTDRDIKFIYFVHYGKNILQCEIVHKRDGRKKYDFTFVHPKTTELKHPDKDIIFDTEFNGLYNHARKINQNMNEKISKRILYYFNADKVFYSDNETGEIMRNYLLWCRSQKL